MNFVMAKAAYGRQPSATDWLSGKDFRIANGGPYFSIRDADRLQSDGVETVHFLDRDGFIAFTAHTDDPKHVYK